MTARQQDWPTLHRWRIAAWSLPILILLVPLVAMQVTDAVKWGPLSFLVMGALLVGTGLLIELALWMNRHPAYRLAAALALVAALLLVWINLAVGIIGAENEDANLLYAGVLALGLAGAVLVRLRPRGMAWTLGIMAFAQCAIAVFALAAGWWDAAVLTVAFAGVWLLSAMLFHKAGQGQAA